MDGRSAWPLSLLPIKLAAYCKRQALFACSPKRNQVNASERGKCQVQVKTQLNAKAGTRGKTMRNTEEPGEPNQTWWLPQWLTGKLACSSIYHRAIGDWRLKGERASKPAEWQLSSDANQVQINACSPPKWQKKSSEFVPTKERQPTRRQTNWLIASVAYLGRRIALARRHRRRASDHQLGELRH